MERQTERQTALEKKPNVVDLVEKMNEQREDDFNGTVEDIPKDQNTGTYAALEPSVSTRTPGQSASSTPVHDATSDLQRPRHSPGLPSSLSQQSINNANKQTFPVKESLKNEAPTSREETPPTSPDVKGGKASDVKYITGHPSPLHIKTLSDQLKKGVFCKNFKNITLQFPSTAEPVMTSLSKLQSKEDDLVSEESPENGTISQQAQKDLSNVDGNLGNSGQTADEAGSSGDLPEDGPMLVEKITHAVEDNVPLSATTMSRLVMSPPGTPGESMDVSLSQAAEKLPSGSSPSYQGCGHDRGCRLCQLGAGMCTEHEQLIMQLQTWHEIRSADSFLNPSNPRAIFCRNLYHNLEDIDGDLEKQCMDAISSIAIQYRTAKRSGMPPPT